MARRGRRRRSRAKRNAASDASVHPLVERIWSKAIQAQTIGILFGLAGLILMITPLLRQPTKPSSTMVAGSWWTSAFYAPGELGLAAALSAVAVVLLAGILWTRVAFARPSRKSEGVVTAEPTADFEFEQSPIPEVALDLADRSRRGIFPWVGAACMVAGIALLAGEWFVAQQKLPPAFTAIANGESIESFTLPHSDAPLKVNLPRRVRLKELQLGEEPSASIQIFQVGQNPGESPSINRTLPAGAGVTFNGYRITFSGVRPSEDKLRATFSSKEPDSVAATASIGKKFRLSLDGPEYKLLGIQENYLNVMGPAAEVESDELGKFWVFSRNSTTSVPPDLKHPILMDRVESEMAGIFTITPAQRFWPISLGGTLFVLGFSLLIIFPERIVRAERGGKVRVWSFHEAGALSDYILRESEDELLAADEDRVAASDDSQPAEPRADKKGDSA